MNRDAGLPKLHETLDDLLAAAPPGRLVVSRDEMDRFCLYLDTGEVGWRTAKLVADTEIDARPLGGHGTRNEALLALFRAAADLYNKAQGFTK